MLYTHLRSKNWQRSRQSKRLANSPITQFSNYSVRSTRPPRKSERGYVLLILLLFVALLSIGFMIAVQKLEFQVKRDREQEMIHRGVQYSRAVRRFFKKTGRYPTRIEELESTNNVRFLRKRYKDPMNRDPKTGKERDFKLLHLQDVQTSFNNASTRGVVSAADLANGDSSSSRTEVQAGAPGALNNGGSNPGGRGPSAITSQDSDTAVSDGITPDGNAPGDPNQAPSDQATASPGTPAAPQPLSQQLGANGAPQVFGGGGIVGVASANKDKTIRVFNKKEHYNQWQFIYDPTTDSGGLLMTPNQPPLMNTAQNVNQQQQNGQPGAFQINGDAGGINGPGGINGGNQNNSAPTPNMPPDQNQ